MRCLDPVPSHPSSWPAAAGYGPGVTLSDALEEQYWRDGFVLLRGLFPPEDLAGFDRRFEDLVEERAPRPEGMVFMQDVMVVKGAVAPSSRLHGINKILSFEEDPVLFDYAVDPRVLGPVRSLIGEDLVTLSTNVFNKPPGVDGRHPLHQDLRYFSLRPADRILASWTAIRPCTRASGCLSVVPGSHRSPLLKHETPDWEYVNSGFFALAEVDLDARVHVEMEPGDTLFFHSALVHGSGRNRSQDFRRAIAVHYASAQCERPPVPRKRQPVMKPIPMERS